MRYEISPYLISSLVLDYAFFISFHYVFYTQTFVCLSKSVLNSIY